MNNCCSDNLCRNIKTLRQSHKLTQAQMAKILHISTASLRKLENGTIPPRVSCNILMYAARYFDIRISELFE